MEEIEGRLCQSPGYLLDHCLQKVAGHVLEARHLQAQYFIVDDTSMACKIELEIQEKKEQDVY